MKCIFTIIINYRATTIMGVKQKNQKSNFKGSLHKKDAPKTNVNKRYPVANSAAEYTQENSLPEISFHQKQPIILFL